LRIVNLQEPSIRTISMQLVHFRDRLCFLSHRKNWEWDFHRHILPYLQNFKSSKCFPSRRWMLIKNCQVIPRFAALIRGGIFHKSESVSSESDWHRLNSQF
jgi:hypothetical protein